MAWAIRYRWRDSPRWMYAHDALLDETRAFPTKTLANQWASLSFRGAKVEIVPLKTGDDNNDYITR